MKRIIILAIMLSLTAACEKKEDQVRRAVVTATLYPKFAKDQHVHIVSGFYRDHDGKIVDWTNRCIDRDTEEQIVCYKILLDSPDGIQGEIIEKVNEKDLQ